ncbi:COBRA-like protein 10 [Dichanthelium oligosanthes]|uniref:COBRA-like protein 10 n=1 Tax=Dichanthelium oligosanthes TaxID=888268 RepID=A0A1E5VUJ7_9POAL|nr:COBRA-like protein 10 [Dichanthelium oligosanthes]
MVMAAPVPLRRRWALMVVVLFAVVAAAVAQDYNDGGGDDEEDEKKKPQYKAQESCNGVFLSYTFMERTKEYPHLKNATAQPYAFKATATVLNTMTQDLKAWQMFVGFQHKEILVSVGGAVLLDGSDLPANVSGGVTFAGYPMADLLNSIDTAGEESLIESKIEITGTQFGVKSPGKPMPKTIKLTNPAGFRCPAPTRKDSVMYVCCVKDPKFKAKKANSTRYVARQKADLTFAYDVLQANANSYMAQVTIDNWSPISRLDNWNLTWEWKRGEFIYSMKGAYTLLKEGPACVYSPAAGYYKDLDFTPVYNCEKRPVIVDLPPEREKDKDVGNVPFCCKNGTLLPPTMDPSKSKAMFQMQVFKMPPDLNRTALYPPQSWKISGKLNPQYTCGQPIRVSPQEFPDATGLLSSTPAVASWQVACNITRPKKRASKCCVSFSSFYNDSVVPCNTCACGCGSDTTATCDPDARAMLLPPEALLIPFENRTAKARAWAKIKHWRVPNPMPCSDNCGLSINWHVINNYKSGWSVRMTIFNWQDYTFKDWFAAVTMGDHYSGYENVYSFNGTRMDAPFNNTIFMQGVPGLTYLDAITDGKTPADPRVPGKQQSVISFKRKDAPNINIAKGEGFPKRVYFDGEECALPDRIPKVSSAHRRAGTPSLTQVAMAAALVMVVALVDSLRL